MKKLSFTLSQPRNWMLLTLTLVFVCFSSLTIHAQGLVKMPKDSKATSTKLTSCNNEVTKDSPVQFTDDGSNDGNYADDAARIDTTTFCPTDQWSRVKVVFTDFDLAKGDTLFAFQGNNAAFAAAGLSKLLAASGSLPVGTAIPAGTTSLASARSVADAFGGWIDADCDPAINPSGCLTFIFKTNGDRAKGTGWDAWVDCEARKVALSGVTIADVKLRCTEGTPAPVDTLITIAAPTVKGCGVDITDSVFLRVHNQHGHIVANTMLAGGLLGSITKRFAIGQYMAIFKLKSDTSKTLSVPFSVQAPALVGNDEIRVPMGAACMAVLTPDDILEQACDTGRHLQYNITVTIGKGKDKVELKTTGHDMLAGPVKYPIITGADIKKAGVSICGGTATVRIERIYYGDRDKDKAPDLRVAGVCHNGTQSLYAETVLRFNDESNPWVDVKSAPDTLIACDTTGLSKMLKAEAIDNCDDKLAVTYTVTLAETDPCFDSDGKKKPDTTTATVVFTAIDDCGNIGTASKVITMIRPDITDARFIAKSPNVKVECKNAATFVAPGLKVGVLKDGKFEVKDTVALNTETYVCGYILVSTQELIPGTDCGEKKYVYWDALDWCDPSGGPKRVDTTFIETTDETAPTFDAGEGTAQTIELDHFSCTYDISKITQPKASDNCDDNPEVVLGAVHRIEDGGLWAIPAADWAKLDCDSFQLTWYASDDCHEQTKQDTLKQTVVIKDVTAPSAACQDQLNVSLPNEWGARVCAKDIDAGSYDACGIESILIRIKGSGNAWTECIDIGCEYVHPDLQIEMQVTDKKGNTNTCWLDVVVEDKISPICEDLEDKNEDCDEYHNGELGEATDTYVALEGDLMNFYNTKFGNPEDLKKCEDNLNATECGKLTYEQQYKLSVWPCGEQIAHRRYRATDWSGNKSGWSEQKITITYKANWKITLPADWAGACGETAPAEDIVISNGACDLLGYEVTEKQFDIPGDACFKIERTYHIINWCKFVAGQDPVEIARVEGDHGVVDATRMITSEGNEDKGYWTYIQVLKVHDDVAPVVTVIDPTPCISGVDFDAEPYGEEDNTPGSGPFECDELKVWSATATDCSSNISWEGKLYNVATGALVTTTKTNEIAHVVSNKETYYAEFWAYDNCGNSAGNRGADVKFWDCKKPTPYVLNGVAVDLGETASVQVWATDLNQNSFDNCTDQSKLDFRIWADFLEGDAPTDGAGVSALSKVLTFDCARVGTNVVYIYVMDEEGNWDFAQTYVIVQDNMAACDNDPQGGMVAGKIVNANGENVEAVNITVTGGADKSLTTGADGQFQFALATGADYTVTPIKDINPLNGVSTFDLVLISKHILGITQFDSPYKHIAADVNKSGSITAFDMVQLRQLILNITNEFSNNDSWRFVDASHNFSAANPASENFNEFYNITALNGTMENMDFVGVKIGDVNGNAQANSLLGAESRTTNGALTLTTADRFVEAGETVTVAFTAAEIANTVGYQFTLNVAGQNAEIVEGVAKAANFNTNLAERGVITTSWNGEATTNDELFAVTFSATASGLLSELVTVNSDITTAEAYNTAGELMDVNINFTTTAAAGFTLAQNTPNPFKGETVIGFNLPTAGTATLTVMDVQGKVLKSFKADYAKGANQVTLKAGELSATGVLYYQLESADNVATKKMIIIE